MIDRKKGYNLDMMLVGIFLMLMLCIYLGTDASTGPTEEFKVTYGPLPSDGSDGPDGPDDGDPVLEEEVLVDEAGYTSEGTTTELRFEVPWNKTIEISMTLDWSDDYGDNDEFELVLYLDGERVDGSSGTSGQLDLTQPSPSPGNYSVAISALDCPGRVGPSPIDIDDGNDWTLEVRATYEVVG